MTGTGRLATLLAPPRGESKIAGTTFLSKLTALMVAPPGQPVPPPKSLADYPEPIRMVLVLNLLHYSVGTGGIAAFLEAEEAGAHLREAQKWCGKLGARGAAVYLKEAASLFPKSRVPKDAAKRRAAVRRLTSRVPDPLSGLDEEHRGAVDEIPDRLRDYLRDHRGPLEDWLGADANPEGVHEHPTVAEVLSVRVPRTDVARQSFMQALVELIFAPPDGRRLVMTVLDPSGEVRHVADARRRIPEGVQIILVLNGLWMDVLSGGIAKFLDGGGGSDVVQAERWCRRIGARRTAAYLRAAARQFPEGVVPEPREERSARIDALLNRWPDPLAQLDEKYEGAVNEIPPALHAYVRRHQQVLQQWMEVTYAGPKRTSRSKRGDAKKPIDRQQKVMPKRSTAPRGGRMSVKSRSEVAQRIDRFVADIEALSTKEWLTIGQRWHKQLRAIHAAEETMDDMKWAIYRGQRSPVGLTRAEWITVGQDIASRVARVVNALPTTINAAGKSVPLREYAVAASAFAHDTIWVYAELLESVEGRKAAEVLLAPFDGYITPL